MTGFDCLLDDDEKVRRMATNDERKERVARPFFREPYLECLLRQSVGLSFELAHVLLIGSSLGFDYRLLSEQQSVIEQRLLADRCGHDDFTATMEEWAQRAVKRVQKVNADSTQFEKLRLVDRLDGVRVRTMYPLALRGKDDWCIGGVLPQAFAKTSFVSVHVLYGVNQAGFANLGGIRFGYREGQDPPCPKLTERTIEFFHAHA